MPEELERAVALARDRAGEELERETPPKLSKEGGVKTGGPVEGRKGGKIVEINEKMLPEIGKPGEHSYTILKATAGKKDGPGKIKKGKATTKEQPAAVKDKPIDVPETKSEVQEERKDSVEIEVPGKVAPRKMFVCKVDGCAHSYNYSGGLRDHMRREHGAAKLPCRVPTCPATFTTHRSLGRHMKKEHGAAKERWEVASTNGKNPAGDKEEGGKLLGKRRHSSKEEDGRVKELGKVQKQWEKEREEEVEGELTQEDMFM